MDIGKSFTFVFEDPNWASKIIIGGLITLIPIVGWLFVIGYLVAIARNIINGDQQPLPEWSDFGQIFVDGIYGFVIAFVYVLPIIVVSCIFWAPASLIAPDSGDGGAIHGLVASLILDGHQLVKPLHCLLLVRPQIVPLAVDGDVPPASIFAVPGLVWPSHPSVVFLPRISFQLY